jgi:hypothetical protein
MTHVLITTTGQWIQNVFTVGDLIGAVKQALAPLVNDTSIAELTLHLPEGVTKDSHEGDCFMDKTDAIRHPGLVLTRLNDLGLDDLNPLLIKPRFTVGGMKNFVSESIA